MWETVKQEAKMNLQGHRGVLFGWQVASVAAFFLFLFFCVSSLYLFLVNTEMFRLIGVFRNELTLALSCTAAVIVGLILLLFSVYVRYRKDTAFFLLDEEGSCERISVSDCVRLLTLYSVTFFKKIGCFLLCLLPFGAASAGILVLLGCGIEAVALGILLVGEAVILVAGVFFACVLVGRYALVTDCYRKNPSASLKAIFRESISLMNGKSLHLFRLKCRNFPKRVFSLLILTAPYFLTYCKASEALLAKGIKNPVLSKETKPEKAVVFYCRRRTV